MKSYTTLLAGAAALSLLSACDAKHPLAVKDPDIAPPGSLNSPAALPGIRAGTIADFAVAFAGAADQNNGGHEGVASFGGLFTDELNDIETFPTRQQMNTRTALPPNGSLAGVFQNLGAAHNDARRAQQLYAKFGPNSTGQAEMYALDAYVFILVAEHWCSGEPFSTVDVTTGAVINGKFLSTTDMLDTALAELQLAKQALAADTASGDAAEIPTITGLAGVGTARALLDLGLVTEAADSAALVLPGALYQTLESTNTLRQSNGVWFYNINFPSFSEADQKQTTGLPYVSSNDPRTPATPGAAAGGQPDPFFFADKYRTASAPMTLGDYTEAQLIVAEGKIFAGNYPAALAIMQALRTASGLNFSGSTIQLTNLAAATPKAQMQQLLTERAFWMYVTGHRLGDWRRMLRPPYNGAPFNFVTSDVYPQGPGIQNILEFPTPLLTNPNPNFKACDPTIP